MDPENYVNDFNQFIDKRAFPGVEADHGALNGYMIAEEVLEDLCLDGKENWQKFLEEFKADFDRAAGRLPKLPEVSDQMLLGHLQAQRERINHLLVHTYALGDAAQLDLLPGSVAEPGFFDKLQRLFERMQASGELAAREEAYRQDITVQAEVFHQIEDDIRRGYEEAQRKALLDAVSKGKEGDAALAEAAVLRQKQYQDAARRQSERLHALLVKIGNPYQDYYAEEDGALSRQKLFGRTGAKPQIKPAEQLRLPMTEYAKDALMGLGRGIFIPTEGRDAVFTEIGEAQLRIECDPTGFDTIRAIEMLAAYGPATMQTFLGLMGLWMEHNAGASHETYFTAHASDLMRYMGRKELTGGSYHTADQMQKGREIYILSRATIPRATVQRYNTKKKMRESQTVSMDRLIHVKTLTAQRTLEDGQEIQSCIEFRYHPNEEMYEMLCGSSPQFAEVSGKLLAYHPITHKYHILLGFGLAFYDKVNRRAGDAQRKISLPALLRLAGIDVPKRNVDKFLERIQKAIQGLSKDEVILGAQLDCPQDSSLSARQQLAAGSVVFPALLARRQPGLPVHP